MRRNSQPMIRQDYTAWSSPVSGQNLLAFSPNTIVTRFYEYLFTGTTTPTAYQSVVPSTNNFATAKGYMIRVANTWSSVTPAAFNGQFTGVPNNGTLNSFTFNICSSTTTVTLANDDFEIKDFVIYPNPNNGDFNVKFSSNSNEEIKIGVHDMRGREIFTKSYTNTGLIDQNLQLDNVQAGVYLVTVQDGNRKEVKKIVVE